MKKRILSLLLVLVLLLGLLPTAALAADADTTLTGSGGESATWSYDVDSEILTISGTGTFVKPTSKSDCWQDWKTVYSDATSVTIGEGITELCDSAFSSFKNLSSAKLPTTLKSIGKMAFNFAAAASPVSVTIPASVDYIGSQAFYNNSKCAKILNFQENSDAVLQKILYKFAAGALSGTTTGPVTVYCNGTQLAVPDLVDANKEGSVRSKYDSTTKTITLYGKGEAASAFSKYSTAATAAIVEEGITSLNDKCFSNYTALTSVQLPNSLTKLGDSAFYNCKKLTSLTLPSGLEEIGESCFSNTKLTEIHVPSSIKKIGKWAFSDLPKSGSKIYMEMTLAESDAAGITYADNWWGKSTVYYKNPSGDGYVEVDPAPYAWLKDVEFSYTENGNPLSTNTNVSSSISTIAYAISDAAAASFTIENVGVTLSKDGKPFDDASISLPESITVTKNQYGGWDTDAVLTLTPKEGIRGETRVFKFSFTVTEKPFQFEGDGTKENPYKIDSIDALRALQKNVNTLQETYSGKYFLQTADIDMTGVTSWEPIGLIVNTSADRKFDATYDGGNHKIKNWTVNCSQLDNDRYFGLFGNVTVLKNLTLDESCSFALRSWSGTLAYQATRMENCASYATVTAQTTSGDNSNASIGGLAMRAVSMENCANYGSITVNGGGTVGGLAVDCYNAVNCYNYGTVSATGEKVGGICAELSAVGNKPEEERGVMSACGNYGAVTGGTNVGGLTGTNEGILEDCYNVGAVEATAAAAGTVAGGLTSTMETSSQNTEKLGVFNSYNAGTVSYGTAEGAPCAGQLVGKVQGSGDAAACLGNLYYLQNGDLPAVGNFDAGAAAKAMTASELKANSFVRTLNAYQNISLRGAEWAADADGKNGGYPVIAKAEALKNYENKILSLTLNEQAAIPGENHTFSCLTLPYGTDLTKVTMTAEISARATLSPASGSVLDLSNGPVTLTVTAENGDVQEYTVTTSAASTASGLTALRVTANTIYKVEDLYKSAFSGCLLLDLDDFKPEQTTYRLQRYDMALQGGTLSGNNNAYFWAVPADSGATITAAIGTNTASIAPCTDLMADAAFFKSKLNYWDGTARTSLMTYGQNTMTLTVTPPEGSTGTEVTYTFQIDMLPSLKSVTFAEAGLEQDKDFAYDVLDYELTIPAGVNSLTPTATPSMSDFDTDVNNPAHKIEYQPALSDDGTLDLTGRDSFTVTITGGKDDETRTTTYTYRLHRTQGYTLQLETNAANPQLRITNANGERQSPDASGVYTLTNGKTYTYVLTAKGYKSQTGTITGASDLTDGKLAITLEAVAPNTLKKLDALWPSFRGNDENMAIISAPTRTTSEGTGLLWAAAAGSGMDAGAVSSPILVDGDLYAYAGNSILRINKATGDIIKKGTMVGTSNFSIVPPTYAEGMIFVGLSNGRVQAFNAETLESLWVYTDPLGGQPNSPITYSDGCVYTGFWTGETGKANFVCLSIDDEDPDNKTEAKQALWDYTQTGGFYWAGAYANGDYVVVGTDDGYSGYTHATASLLVFNKDSGALVDYKTGYTGDIRSNVSYDKDSDRVYFTSKGGYFYSEKIDWTTGKIDTADSKAIDLGGMSTSTPVVYKGRAYVGVAGTGQFTPYSGHHIAVLDLTNWSVAYTATTQGYPQTSGMLTTAYEKDDGFVYVYFMDNYTPGVMRVIQDKAGQPELLGGVTESGHENCAPVVYTPTGDLAQYCICSPIADENGVIYFKNDTGNLMAVGEVTGFQGRQITFDANGGSIIGSNIFVTNKLSNKLEKMAVAVRNGYELLGWFTEKEGGQKVTLDTVFSDTATVYAHWKKVADPEEKQTVTVYFSISNDGQYLQSDITGQTLAQLPVTLDYFDLKDYGLEAFYRTGSDGKAVVHPTVLHLFIKMLEQQYLGDDLNVGKSVRSNLQYGKNESDEPYKALQITGTATSMYMTNFWGHDENLLYYVNHQYPLMYEGWGSTADWILLEDGDTIEVAMFTDWNFITSEAAGFPYFREGDTIMDSLTVAVGAEKTLTVARATADASGERGEKLNPNMQVYYTTSLNRDHGDVTKWTPLSSTDGNGNVTVSFDKPGSYYIAVPGSNVSAPGICKVTVLSDTAAAAAAEKIESIGTVTKDSGAAISAAREAYDALSDAQKALVPADTLKKLTDAEEKYAELTKPVTPVTPVTPSTPAQKPFNESAGQTLPFTDVPDTSWYYSGVKYAYENGLMNGTGASQFSPNADTTRGMIVTMLARLEGKDTAGTPWYAAGQKWAMDAGISDGSNMTAAITREQLASMLYRYAKSKGYDVSKAADLGAYTDAAQVSAYASDAMRWAVAVGLIQGSGSKLDPKATATRAQVATILMRFAQLAK